MDQYLSYVYQFLLSIISALSSEGTLCSGVLLRMKIQTEQDLHHKSSLVNEH